MRRKAVFRAMVCLSGGAALGMASAAQQAVAPTEEELSAITERGRLLNEYDQAAWHATDVVQMANPKTVEGQRYIAKKENGKWKVVFGKLNQDRSRFDISYEANQKEQAREFAVQKESPEREDEGFFLFAARALDVAVRDFGPASRPYNAAVLPAPAEQLYVYLYPAQTKARVYPLGGDLRYLMSSDGLKIVEKRLLHSAIIETAPAPPQRKVVAGMHTHVLSDSPEDTDVFHVLTQDPPRPEMIGAGSFLFEIKTDGTIRIVKEKKGKKKEPAQGS